MTPGSVERFRRGFWAKEPLDRALIGILPDRAWLPLHYLREPFGRQRLVPEDVTMGLARNDFEDWGAGRTVQCDDFIPYAAAWRAIPWLEAMCGCEVRYASGSLAPHRCIDELSQLDGWPIPADEAWLDLLARQTAALQPAGPYWVSTTILRGVSDVLAALRGLNDFFLDLHDAPARLAAAADRIAHLHRRVLERHFALVSPKEGGYGHIFGYWAPGPTTVLQEDAMGMCAPGVYRDLFQRHTALLVEALGPYVLFHLHSTGCRHYRHVLEVPGIAGLEITIEQNGPPLESLLPVLQEILERSRLILMLDGWFHQAVPVLTKLRREGLYVLVSEKFIRSEEEFRSFCRDLA